MLTLCQPVDRHYFVLGVFQLSLSFKYSPVSGLRKKKPCQFKITNSWGQLIHSTREFTEVEDKPDLKPYSLILSIFVLSDRAKITHISKENHTYLETIEVMQLFSLILCTSQNVAYLSVQPRKLWFFFIRVNSKSKWNSVKLNSCLIA